MINNYKNRAIFLLFGIISIINIILLSLIFFTYSANLKKDYQEKSSLVASQMSSNTNLVLSFIEEEIEIFINKYSIEESLGSFRIDAPNFVRVDSTSFNDVAIFNGKELVFVSGTENVEYYRNMILDEKFDDITKDTNSRWLINEKKDELMPSYGMLSYVRGLFDADTNEKIGYVVAKVSIERLMELLNLNGSYEDDEKKEFLPQSVGFSVDDKVLFLGKNGVEKDETICNKSDLVVRKNETFFVNVCGTKEFVTIHSTKTLKGKILIVLLLFILLFVAISIISYKILGFLLNEICGRLDNLNNKIEAYSPIKEEKL